MTTQVEQVDSEALSPTPAARTQARASAWLAVLAVLASLLIAPPWRSGRIAPGAAEVISGSVTLVGTGERLGPGDTVPRGSEVHTDRESARLAVAGGDIELGARSELVVDAPLDLRAGSLLLQTQDVVEAGTGLSAASGRGAWRLDAGAAPRVAVYEGGVGVTGAAGTQRALSQLQQYDLTDGPLPSETTPIRYVFADPWDARFLAEAIAVDQHVVQLTRSLAAQYGTAPRDRLFYSDFVSVDRAVSNALPRIAPRTSGDAFGPPADVLVSVIVIDLLASRARLAPEVAVADVLDLRAKGATWGLILALHDLGASDLRGQVDLALRRRVALAQPLPGGSTRPTPSPSPGDPSSPSPSPSPSSSPTGEPTDPPDPDDPGVLDPITDPVDAVLGDLADLIDPIVPGSGAVVDDARDVIDDATSGIGLGILPDRRSRLAP